MDLSIARGFRDSMLSDAERLEEISNRVAALFASRSYRLISTPLVEKSFVFENFKSPELNGDNSDLFRLIDTDGELLSLKADVTLPIARVVATRFKELEPPFRLRYSTEVYREQEMLRATPRASRQAGVEFIGDSSIEADVELLVLAFDALISLGIDAATIHLSDAGILNALIADLDDVEFGDEWRAQALSFAHRGNFVGLRDLVKNSSLNEEYEQVFMLLTSVGGGLEALMSCLTLLRGLKSQERATEAASRLLELYERPELAAFKDRLKIDLSLMRDFSYYTGFVFEIYAPSFAFSLGGGGRYDATLRRFGRDLPAAGFMLALDDISKYLSIQAPREERPLRIAIPKGALFADSLKCLEAAGLNVDALKDADRVLFLKAPGLEFVIAKPSDVAIYVANGAADCGIGGKDILIEADYPLLELVDLDFGACRFVVAAEQSEMRSLEELAIDKGVVRVASKYPRTTSSFFNSRGVQADVIKLNGNIEVAALIGISDLIVDITATGKTLRDNNLKIMNEILSSTARFVANPARARADERIAKLCQAMQANLKGRRNDSD